MELAKSMETTIEAFIPMALGIARHQAALKHIDYDIAVSAGLEGVARAAATWDPKGKLWRTKTCGWP
jgi:hypothetical protein